MKIAPKKKKLKPIPRFNSEAEERKFWETHDTFDYVDWSKAYRARFPNLKLSSPADASAAPRDRNKADSS
jgi:CopG antitoxin of type II toxin-antitoxin system